MNERSIVVRGRGPASDAVVDAVAERDDVSVTRVDANAREQRGGDSGGLLDLDSGAGDTGDVGGPFAPSPGESDANADTGGTTTVQRERAGETGGSIEGSADAVDTCCRQIEETNRAKKSAAGVRSSGP